MRTISLFLIYFGITVNCDSQEILVGQSVPDIEFVNVLNYKNGKIKMSDFKGKLIIIDFWSHNCLACFKGFPELDSLQKHFPAKIQIILVNRENEATTKEFFAKRKNIKMPDLPMITGDTILEKLFPHTGVPHHVWINSHGVVTYSTYSYYATKKNIARFLTGEDLKLTKINKSQYIEDLFDRRIGNQPAYYSYIGYCINEGSIHFSGPADKSNSITSDNCLSAVQLYQIAYNDSSNIFNYKFSRPGRTLLEVNDPYKYIRPEDVDDLQFWASNYSYYYQLQLPKNVSCNKYEIMREDLKIFFHLNANIEKRSVKCYVLERIDSHDRLKTKGGFTKNNFMPVDLRYLDIDSIRTIKNLPFIEFANLLQTYIEIFIKEPFFDNTKYRGNIDIYMKGETLDFPSIEGFNGELRKYGLRLVKKEIQMDVLVLKER